jgi:hypothetical protein
MTQLEDSNPPAELSANWTMKLRCEPHTYPFKLTVRGVDRIINNYVDHHTVIKSNCERYEAEEKARKNKLTIITL